MTDKEYLKKYLSPSKYEDGLKQLDRGIPVQYIVGSVDFYGNLIEVNDKVLIPRFETEQLVEKTLMYLKKYLNEPLRIVDIGTGSGCIAITLKKKLNCVVTATDISEDAIAVAMKNAKQNNVVIDFRLGNILEPLKEKYDVLISNPPYISYDENIDDLVKNNEPHLALYASSNGLYFYEEILKKCCDYLNKSNIIAFEIGCNQGESIKKMAVKYFPYGNVIIEQDLQKKDRFLFIINK